MRMKRARAPEWAKPEETYIHNFFTMALRLNSRLVLHSAAHHCPDMPQNWPMRESPVVVEGGA